MKKIILMVSIGMACLYASNVELNSTVDEFKHLPSLSITPPEQYCPAIEKCSCSPVVGDESCKCSPSTQGEHCHIGGQK